MKSLFLLLFITLPSMVFAQTSQFSPELYKGKVVYIDFWASWCGPCKESFPWLNELQAKYKDKLVIVGINLDKEKAKADEFLSATPAKFQILFNPEGQLAKRYNVKGMPYSVILDKDGKVIHTHIGFHKDKTAEYTQIIEGALK